MTEQRSILVLTAGALVLLATLLTSLGGGPAAAAPSAAPTPVANVGHAAKPSGVLVFWDSKVLTTAVGSSAQGAAEHTAVDVQWIIDQGTVPNTTTLKLQFSNNGINWVDGATFVTNNVANVSDMQQLALFGRYARVLPTFGGTQPVTLTVIGVAK